VGAGGYRLGNAEVHDSVLRDGLNDAFSEQHSGWHTEDLVKSRQITREEQDRWAERSQKRFPAAQAAGKFVAEIAPVELCERNKPGLFQKDEHNRPETTLESLAKLRPAFRKDDTITAGNAPGLNSGAAAMIVSEADRGQQLFRIGGGRGDQPVRVQLGRGPSDRRWRADRSAGDAVGGLDRQSVEGLVRKRREVGRASLALTRTRPMKPNLVRQQSTPTERERRDLSLTWPTPDGLRRYD